MTQSETSLHELRQQRPEWAPWLAVVQVVVGELALISPPEGINLFILQDIGKATAAEVARGVIPFLAIMALFLIVICIFPSLTLWLPALLLGA